MNLKNLGNMHIEKQSASDLKEMLVLSLSNPIFLWSTKIGSLMEDIKLSDVRGKTCYIYFPPLLEWWTFCFFFWIDYDESST